MIKEDKEIDFRLIKASLVGSKDALDQLVKKHHSYTFNICLKVVYNHQDAEDLTQEIWIKTITKLERFKFKSAFSTWLYRITVNHLLDMKKKSVELEISNGFDNYSDSLNNIADQNLSIDESIILKESIEEAKISCMSGMLMCLDREQRLIYVLGDIFNINHKLGSEIFDISSDNYRQKLSRARKDLHEFMNNQCSLVNKANPCKCNKKTKGFIKLGYVNPENLMFNKNFKNTIGDKLVKKSDELDSIIGKIHAKQFQKHPFEETQQDLVDEIINNKQLNKLLRLS